MPEILVLCSGREGRRIVEGQLRSIGAEVAYLNARTELRSAALESGVRAVVSDLFDGDGRPMAPFLRELQHGVPELKIVLSYDPSPAALDDVLEAATSGARFAFAARPFNNVARLLAPVLSVRSTRPPSAAERLLLHVVPHVRTAAARRCVTLGSVSPAHHMSAPLVASFCGTAERTLHRHLIHLASPKLLLNALAWPQANYLLTTLHWSAREVSAYFEYRRPAFLIDLLADYVESGMWRLGLDAAVDGVAAVQAEEMLPQTRAEWLHRRRFRSRGALEPVLGSERAKFLDDVPWNYYPRHEVGGTILSLLGGGLSPMEVVRRLWRRYDVGPSQLYRGVIELLEAARSRGLVEEAS